MKPSDLPALRTPGVPTVSPDGRLAVVAVSRPDLDADDYTGQLWLVPTDGTAPPRRLTYGWRDAEPRWSPDGRWLAFTRAERSTAGVAGRPQLWLLPAVERAGEVGGEPRRLTDHPLGVSGPVWSPDSTRLAYVARVPEPGRYGGDERAEPPRRITRLRFRVDDLGFVADRPSHIWVVDIEGGEPVRVTDGDFDHVGVDWNPAGDLLAFTAARHATAGDDLRVDVWTCRPDGSDLRALTNGGLVAAQPRFTPDGAAVCFVSPKLGPGDRGGAWSTTGLWSVPVAEPADPVRLTDPEWFHLAKPAGMIVTTGDGVLFTDEHRGSVRLLRVPYRGGEPVALVDGERQVIAAAESAGVTVASVADPATPGELVLVSDAGLTPLTSWGTGFRTEVGLTPMTALTAIAPDGYPVHGWVLVPEGEGPHPVLLNIHGGPFFQYGWTLFDEAQVYAGAGYAVVLGNPRGSSGYGQAHARAVVADVGEVSTTDLLALLDAALAAYPTLDPDRVGVMGGSHGGYMTTWLAAHHGHRFRAAISERAVNAVDSFAGSSDIGWWFVDDVYGPDPARQAAQNPLAYADKISIPMLLIHSEQDWRCPVEQAQRLFVALKSRGAPVELLLFPGEGHELSRSGRPRHRRARFEAILEWWSRYLG